MCVGVGVGVGVIWVEIKVFIPGTKNSFRLTRIDSFLEVVLTRLDLLAFKIHNHASSQ